MQCQHYQNDSTGTYYQCINGAVENESYCKLHQRSQPSPDEAQIEAWIRETVEECGKRLGFSDAHFAATIANVLCERLPLLLGRGNEV